MLIPSIDLMGGKIVQLVQGERKALEFADLEEWARRFAPYPLVQLVDLDRALGHGNNRTLVENLVRRLPCQVGGGLRSLEAARHLLELGARRVILGSVLIKNGQVDRAAAAHFAECLGPEKLTFALDAKQGQVAIKGWREQTQILPEEMMRALEPYCRAFLYTHIDGEGLLEGIPFEVVLRLRQATSRQLIVAGGIATRAEVDRLEAIGADAVVGMALYLGRIELASQKAEER
ncbi:MAG TPA: 1-(5-phosphoribosyl)-5-[(5-phosphoribosylamino)methylideneamino] imidazole-4-carboxamide isomerase [Terriglobales bacterium]|nr:1-(5-phosphoribosyl)-5-[(5-phosphoribosylamino)methylideneamino] imidazole-4-carboxamide isomerase [Terriglobales bacterium]